jgi:hypothetical protein
MRSRDYGLYAVALAIVVVGALWAGVPVGTLALLGLVLVCPLMMIFMMRGRGMHRGDSGEGHRHDSADGDSAHRSGPRGHTGTP